MVDYQELHALAVAERKQIAERLASLAEKVANVTHYNRRMDALELSPNGDDYNTVLELLGGAPFREPHTEGR